MWHALTWLSEGGQGQGRRCPRSRQQRLRECESFGKVTSCRNVCKERFQILKMRKAMRIVCIRSRVRIKTCVYPRCRRARQRPYIITRLDGNHSNAQVVRAKTRRWVFAKPPRVSNVHIVLLRSWLSDTIIRTFWNASHLIARPRDAHWHASITLSAYCLHAESLGSAPSFKSQLEPHTMSTTVRLGPTIGATFVGAMVTGMYISLSTHSGIYYVH